MALHAPPCAGQSPAAQDDAFAHHEHQCYGQQHQREPGCIDAVKGAGVLVEDGVAEDLIAHERHHPEIPQRVESNNQPAGHERRHELAQDDAPEYGRFRMAHAAGAFLKAGIQPEQR